MTRSFTPIPLPPAPSKSGRAPARSGSVYTHPEDVVGDPSLPTAEKRALLASWISDARAVENAPALRRLDSGALVEVDAIRRALASLDDGASGRNEPRMRLSPFARPRGAISKWLGRVGQTRDPSDDDDDPPPAPAGLGRAFRLESIAAHGVVPGGTPELACAA